MCAVTVIVITRNRAALLRKTLEKLTALPEQPPIIVVDNGSDDDTSEVVDGWGGAVTGIRLRRNAGAAGRNVGVRHARTRYVAFCDDDSWWAPRALTGIAQIFERHPRLGLLAARMLVGRAERLDPFCVGLEKSPLPRAPDLPGPSVLGFMACGAAVRRAAFLEAGGFHRCMGVGGEERLLAIDLARRGWGLAYCEDVVAHHHPAPGDPRPGRKARLVRNDLWTAWLRYRAPQALAATRRSMTSAGFLAALAGLPWVLRERAPIPLALQRELELLTALPSRYKNATSPT